MSMKNLDYIEKDKVALYFGSQRKVKFKPKLTGKFGALNLVKDEPTELSSNAYNMLVEYFPNAIGDIISIDGRPVSKPYSAKTKEDIKKEILKELKDKDTKEDKKPTVRDRK